MPHDFWKCTDYQKYLLQFPRKLEVQGLKRNFLVIHLGWVAALGDTHKSDRSHELLPEAPGLVVGFAHVLPVIHRLQLEVDFVFEHSAKGFYIPLRLPHGSTYSTHILFY